MDIFKDKEMSKSRPHVKDKLKEWYNWLVNNVPEPIKEKASRAFKKFKGKIMGLYEWVKGEKELKKESKMKNPLTQWSLSKLLIGPIGVLELIEEVEWT